MKLNLQIVALFNTSNVNKYCVTSLFTTTLLVEVYSEGSLPLLVEVFRSVTSIYYETQVFDRYNFNQFRFNFTFHCFSFGYGLLSKHFALAKDPGLGRNHIGQTKEY